MTRRWSLLAVVLLMAVHSLAWAGGEPRTHDGFLLRLSAGGGTASTKIEDATGKLDLSDAVPDWNFAVGGVVTPNLAIHGTLWGWTMTDPDAELTITGGGTGTGTLNGDVTMSAVGGGVTYYAMPVNLYFSGSVGVARLVVDSPGGFDGNTDLGPAVDVTVGKEWWVANSWGLGLAGGFSYHSLKDPDISENWTGTSFTLRFSATFN
jgi:hypothetical protein